MKIQLSSDLEKSLLRAIAEGVCPPEAITQEELSKHAGVIYQAIKYLIDRKTKLPLKPASILLTATSVFGVEKKTAKAYLRSFRSLESGEEITTILKAARDKSMLVSLINESGKQLATGDLRTKELLHLLERNTDGTEKLTPLSTEVTSNFPKPPSGFQIRSLPRISEYVKGLFGIWVIGGEPGLGKSSFAWQLALDYARSKRATLYYDLDGTGKSEIIDRTRQIVRGSVKLYRKLTKRIHYRETITTLEEDLIKIPPPALVIIDSAQTLPSSIKFQKQSLDEWVKRIKGIRKKGYTVIVVSEKPRSQYGSANMAGYKGTGDIEYAGSLCLQMLEDEEDENIIQLHVVKNRHGAHKGHMINLERDKKRIFWFIESEAM